MDVVCVGKDKVNEMGEDRDRSEDKKEERDNSSFGYVSSSRTWCGMRCTATGTETETAAGTVDVSGASLATRRFLPFLGTVSHQVCPPYDHHHQGVCPSSSSNIVSPGMIEHRAQPPVPPSPASLVHNDEKRLVCGNNSDHNSGWISRRSGSKKRRRGGEIDMVPELKEVRDKLEALLRAGTTRKLSKAEGEEAERHRSKLVSVGLRARNSVNGAGVGGQAN